MDAQEIRARAIESASALMGTKDFYDAVINGLPPQADHFRWLVTHLGTYIETGLWEHNSWGMNPAVAWRRQGQDEDEESVVN